MPLFLLAYADTSRPWISWLFDRKPNKGDGIQNSRSCRVTLIPIMLFFLDKKGKHHIILFKSCFQFLFFLFSRPTSDTT